MLLPTVDTIKSRYLFGIPLTDDSGNTYSDLIIQDWIDAAVSWLETELQIKIRPTQFTEFHDYHIDNYQIFCYLQLYNYPVVSVQSLKASYAGQDVMTFPVEWIKLFPMAGQIQLVPTTGSLAQILLGQGSAVLLPLITNKLAYMPFLFQADYTAGFAENYYTGTSQTTTRYNIVVLNSNSSVTTDFYKGGEITITSGEDVGETATITSYSGTTKEAKVNRAFTSLPSSVGYSIHTSDCPPQICNLVGMYAACGIMDVIGDVLMGIGVTNDSLSIDGLSQSIGIARSPQAGLFGARLTSYRQLFKDELPRLRERFKGIRLAVI